MKSVCDLYLKGIGKCSVRVVVMVCVSLHSIAICKAKLPLMQVLWAVLAAAGLAKGAHGFLTNTVFTFPIPEHSPAYYGLDN